MAFCIMPVRLYIYDPWFKVAETCNEIVRLSLPSFKDKNFPCIFFFRKRLVETIAIHTKVVGVVEYIEIETSKLPDYFR